MSALAGTGILVRLAVRRDLVAGLTWTTLFCVLLAVMTGSFRDAYPDSAALEGYASATAASPMQHFFNGPGAALGTYGGMVVFEMGGYLVVIVALLSILTVVRHSRAEEANGDAELIRAGCAGRHSLGASAAIVAIATASWWGLACAVTLGALGLGWGGAAAFGFSIAAAGAIFATVAAIASQIGEYPRTAIFLGCAVLAVSFVLRGFEDMRDDGLRWLSPLGWAQATRPFETAQPWPLALAVVFVVLGHLAAVVLNDRRDLGGGWWSPRPGPVAASAGLRKLRGLARVQQSPTALGWWITLSGLGLAFGLVSREFYEAGDQLDLGSFVADVSDPKAALIDFSALLLAVLAAATGIALIGAAAAEESSGRIQATLAGAVSRWRWIGWQLAGALAGSAIALAGGAVGLACGLKVADADVSIVDPMLAVLAYLPATWVTVAIAVAIFGLLPRMLTLAWLPVAYAVIAGLFGQMLRIPAWAMNASPFAHIPSVPDATYLILAPFLMAALAVVIVGVGIRGFTRRDILG